MHVIFVLILICSTALARELKYDWRSNGNIENMLEARPSAEGPHAFDFDWKNVKNIWKSPALASTAKNLSINVDDDIAYPNLGSRIVGGNVAIPGQFPHHALLILSDGVASYWCGGSFVNPLWVMSAAHCSTGMTSVNVYSMVDVNVGYYWTTYATMYVIPGNYDPVAHQNDITMIKLATAVSVSAYSDLIALPRTNLGNTFAGYTATIQGFGRTSDASSDVSTQLKYVSMPVLDNTICAQTWNIGASQVCLATTGGRGACNGDSGGGAFVDDGGRQVIGIVSYGAAAGCELGYPVVYTRVTSFISWIDNVTQNY
jgi:secreted trypsin-like serine protease